MRKKKKLDISIYPTKQLNELAEVIAGVVVPSKKRLSTGSWQLIRGRNIIKGSVKPSSVFIPEDIVQQHPKAIIIPSDILISTHFGKYRIGIVPENLGAAIIDKGIVRVRPKIIQKEYLFKYLTTQSGKTTILEQLLHVTRGDVIKFVTVSDIRKLKIPILPSQILEGLDSDVLTELWSFYDLRRTYRLHKQEIAKIIRDLLLKKGWRNSDIDFEYRISSGLIADVTLSKNKKLVAIIEIKKDPRDLKFALQQIKMICEQARVQFGYLVTTEGIFEVELKTDKVNKVEDLPAPNEIE